MSPADLAIVLPTTGDPLVMDSAVQAADDLNKHLELVTGVDVPIVNSPGAAPGKYYLYTGRDMSMPTPETARYDIAADGVYFVGEWRGARYAAYMFMENELGVRWIHPGDGGILYKPLSTLDLTLGSVQWDPPLALRKMRWNAKVGQYPVISTDLEEFAAFARTNAEHDEYAIQVATWTGHLLMGSHSDISYGHAFTTWWDTYGATRPHYFALNQYGVREPETSDAAAVKLNVSHPDVTSQVISNWLGSGKKWINVCENDQTWGFCRDAECVALDVMLPGEDFGDHLTDRYVYFANQVARAATNHDPQAGSVMYAYNATEQPPRAQTVDPNVAVVVVPTTLELPKSEALFGGWSAAGATTLGVRPNLTRVYETLVLPLGHEKQMYDAFQIAYTNGAVIADYDRLLGIWTTHGMANYVLMKAMTDPSRSYDYWEDHYCSAYGAAAGDVKAYHTYWRTNLWEGRLLPNIETIIDLGKFNNFIRGLTWSLDDYYDTSDFDQSDAIVAAGLARDLTARERAKLEELALANQHARKFYEAAIRKNLVSQQDYALDLLLFREAHQDDLTLDWIDLFAVEMAYGDYAGVKVAAQLREYLTPWSGTAIAWQFKLDTNDVGVAEAWYTQPWTQVEAEWDRLRCDSNWENFYGSEPFPSSEYRAILPTYDGVAWYAMRMKALKEWEGEGREVYLHFPAVADACALYVNGQYAGDHPFDHPDDWKTPFALRVDHLINWATGGSTYTDDQVFTVRVEDFGGTGGIWKRPWLVSRDPVGTTILDLGLEDTVALEFLSESGTVYELQFTTDLVSSSLWQNAGAALTGTGTNMFFFDPNEATGTSTSKAYRIGEP